MKLRCEAPAFDPGGGGINVSRAIRIMGGDSVALVALGAGVLQVNAGGGNLVATDVMTYVEKQGTVKPAVEGRIKQVGK